MVNRNNLIKKELLILKTAIERAEKKTGKKVINSPIVKKIINIVEIFLQSRRLLCYGGTAINNILPKKAQFYNKDIEIPDYDFFSTNALQDAKNLADIYFKNGFEEIEAKAGVHFGTFKVFVNFIPVADITQMDPLIFNVLYKEAITINNISYVPPNFLRMALYLELSRPEGDVSRWEKVFKRLILLNDYHPLVANQCKMIKLDNEMDKTYNTIKKIIIDLGLIFFGSFAISQYSLLNHKKSRKVIENDGSFKVLSNFPLDSLLAIKQKLNKKGITDIEFIRKPAIGEIIAPYYRVVIKNTFTIYLYKPLACHSYNVIKIKGKKVKIATIDTLLSFYLAFLYSGDSEYNIHDILCLAEFLFNLQAKNRLSQKGVLKRFSTSCYGEQSTLKNIRAQKAEKFKELKNKKDSTEYQEYFLRYIPRKKTRKTKTKKTKTKKTKTKK